MRLLAVDYSSRVQVCDLYGTMAETIVIQGLPSLPLENMLKYRYSQDGSMRGSKEKPERRLCVSSNKTYKTLRKARQCRGLGLPKL